MLRNILRELVRSPGGMLLVAAVPVAAILAALDGPVLAPVAVLMIFAAFAHQGVRRERSAGIVAISPRSDPQAAERMAAILSAIPDPVVVVGSDERIMALNARASEVFPSLAPRQPLSFTLRSPDILDALAKVLAGEAVAAADLVEKAPVERAFEVQIARVALDDRRDAGAPPVVIFFRDVTSARKLERMRADFVANASHELRTPLASLSGFIETLEGPAERDPVARKRFLGIMREQASRMSRLIDDLLSLSRIELNLHLPPTGELELSPIVRETIDHMAALARELQVTCNYDAPAVPIVVKGDRDELIRVVENLIENAIKYGGAAGRVDISLKRNGKNAEIAIQDYGRGIASQHIPRLTERFYRVDVPDSRGKGGTGLGLAIVRNILSRHGGRLAIDSGIDRGSTFTAILPALD